MERIRLALKQSGIDVSRRTVYRVMKEKIYQIAACKLPREQVKTIIFRYVFAYYNRIRIYTRNPLGLPPVRYREWTAAQRSAVA